MSEIFRNLLRRITVNVIIVFAIALAAFLAYFKGEITITNWVLLTLFGSITAISFYRLFQLMGSVGESLGIQRSAPSIDGSISGWRLTPTLALLLISCLFAVATLVTVVNATKRAAPVNERTASSANQDMNQRSQSTGKDSARSNPDSLNAEKGTSRLNH